MVGIAVVWVVAAGAGEPVSGPGSRPVVAADTAGRSVVVWQYHEDGRSHIAGQLLDRAGAPIGAPLSISGTDQLSPDALFLPSGELVIAWQSRQADSARISARRFDSYSALPLGDELIVSQWSPALSRPAIDSDDLGRLVVAWAGTAQPLRSPQRPQYQVLVRRFDSLSGHRLGSELRFGRLSEPLAPALAVSSAGDFLVVWESPSHDLAARIFDHYGIPAGAIFRVNGSPGHHSAPAAASGPGGEYTVVWDLQESSGLRSVNSRRLSQSGFPIGAEYRISLTRCDDSTQPAVAVDELGGALVSWRCHQHGRDRMMVRRLDSYGKPLGSEDELDPPVDPEGTASSSPGTIHRTDSYRIPIGREDPPSPQTEPDLGFDYGKPSLYPAHPDTTHATLDHIGNPLGTEIDPPSQSPITSPGTESGPAGHLVIWRSDSGEGAGTIHRLDNIGHTLGTEGKTSPTRTSAGPDAIAVGHGGFLVVWEPSGDQDLVPTQHTLQDIGEPIGSETGGGSS
jgi:hypothetical protein